MALTNLNKLFVRVTDAGLRDAVITKSGTDNKIYFLTTTHKIITHGAAYGLSTDVQAQIAKIKTILKTYYDNGTEDAVKDAIYAVQSALDTSNVINMVGMFQLCSSLKSLDVSNFDTSKVTDMSWMFNSCMALTSLDVSGWDTSNVTSMRTALKTIRMVGCSQTTIDKIKAQLATDGITDCTIVTE